LFDVFLKKIKKTFIIILTSFIMPISILAYSEYIIAGGENVGIEINWEGKELATGQLQKTNLLQLQLLKQISLSIMVLKTKGKAQRALPEIPTQPDHTLYEKRFQSLSYCDSRRCTQHQH
jgi:hypothetical protein